MKRLQFVIGLSFAVLALLFVSAPAFGQGGTAKVVGQVTDPSGAIISKATVTATNDATHVSHQTQSNDGGNFTFPELHPGIYDFTVEAQGFKKANFAALTLTVDQALTLNVRLEVGATTQTVTVAAETVAQLNTTDAQVGTVVDDRQLKDLPLILRDPYQLILLTPGAVQSNSRLGTFSVNGSREQNNNFKLDGADNNDPGVPASGLAGLNPDVTEEFRVINASYLPEFGRNSGAVVDIITKSGTNQFHGDVYEFGRWSATGARGFFNHLPNTKKDPYTRNQFGASVGGPVIKDKTFFFFNYEGDRFATSLTCTTCPVVPDPAFHTGIFTVGAQNYNVSTPTSADNAHGLTLDPTIQKVLAVFPSAGPNGPGGDDVISGLAGHFFFAPADHFSSNNYTARVDHNFSSKETVYVRYILNKGFDDGNSFESLPNGINALPSPFRTQSFAGHLASTLSGSLLNDFQASGVRSLASFGCGGLNVIDGLTTAKDPFGRGRDFSIPNLTTIGCATLGDSDGQSRPFGTYNIGDNLTWTMGRHTAKFGLEYADEYSNDANNFSTRSSPTFTNRSDSGVNAATVCGACGNGGNIALQNTIWGLFGSVDQESIQQFFTPGATPTRVGTDIRGEREHDVYLFAQDQFKITSSFTLNFGMRYEYTGTPYEVHNLLSSITPAQASGPAPITFQFVTHGGANPLYGADARGFEPRIGFAWDPFKTGKTSIRGGYGLFRDRYFFNITGNTRSNPPAGVFITNSAFASLGPVAADQVSNLSIPATASAPSATVFNFPDPTSLGFPGLIDNSFKLARVQNWNLGFQRELPGNTQLEVNYVGVKANHLHRVVDGNAPNPANIAADRAFCQANPGTCTDTPTFSDVQGFPLYVPLAFGLPASFAAVQNSAFFHANLEKSISSSIYHGLQTTITRRFSHGLFIQGAYTYSHAIDDSGDTLSPSEHNLVFPASSFNLRPERGQSGFDERHRFVMNFTAELPVGRGKAHLSEGVVGKIAEGWALSGIYTLSRGTPFDVFTVVDTQGSGSTQRANFNPSAASQPLPVGNSQRVQFLPNPAKFSDPFFGGPGNLGKNVFTGPGTNNWDMVLAKTTKITERFNLEFRIESYNPFNRTRFDQPHTTVGFRDFGQTTATLSQNDGTTTNRQFQFGAKLHF